MRLILDTNVLIDGRVPTGVDDQAAISIATLAELRFGVPIARTPGSRSARMRVLSSAESALAALPIDDTVASSSALLATKTVATGRQPRARAFDLLIAATAHAHGALLVTSSVGDFAGLGRSIPVT